MSARRMRRKEDPRLITGRASYVDDIYFRAAVGGVRALSRGARQDRLDRCVRGARPRGIHAVFTNADLDIGRACRWPGCRRASTVKNPEHWALAKGTVKHVGDPVALVIGDDRYAVVDAAEDVVVEYEPLPVVTDPEKALEDGRRSSTRVRHQQGARVVAGGGDLEAGFAEADVIVERRIVNHRIAGAPIEPRGVLAEFRADRLTVWTSTQVPHFLRLFMAILLGIGEDRVRVIAPEVGGGFGSKLQIYGEEVGSRWASRKLGRPIKWIETRSENMMVTHQGRDQIDYVKMGAKRDGTITAFHSKIIADFGAYNMLLTPLIPSLGAFVMGGVYYTPASRPTSSACSPTSSRPMRSGERAGRRRPT